MFPGLLTATSLALAVAAGPSIPSEWIHLTVDGWTADGSAATWYAALDPGGECAPLYFSVITDAEGKAFEIFSQNSIPTDSEGRPCEIFTQDRLPKDQMSREAKDLWKRGRGEDGEAALKQWIKEHPVAKASIVRGKAEAREIPGGREPVKLSTLSDGRECPTLTLFAEWGSISGPVGELRCTAPERKYKARHFGSNVQAVWSPDGLRLAVSWSVARATTTSLAQSFDTYRMLVISRRSFASIDLLDAGATARVDSLAGELEKAGFRLAHRGKAKDPHAQTEIFYAPGFEPEAREVAKLAGADDANVKPLSWKSPYAITVALGAK